MSLILRPPDDAPPLPERLAELGRARRRALVAAGTFRFVAVVLFALAAAGTLDAAVHLPGVVRAVLLVGTLTAAGVVFLRSVRTPAGEPTHPLAVAMMLEERFPRLNDSLASAVDFLQGDEGTLTRFRRVAVVRAENLAARHDFDTLVPSGRAWRAFWLALFVASVSAVLGLLDPGRTALALTRLADPFGHHPWPTKTTVTIDEPAAFPHRLARGDPFTLRFSVRGVLPEKATVIVRPVGGAPSEDAVALTVPEGETPAEVSVEHTIDSGRVGKDFEVKILANDFESDWLPVSVAPPPRLVPLDDRPSPHVRLTFPAYTDLPPVALPDGIGVVDAVAGTVVHFRAATDRRIVAAAFHPQADLTPLLSATAAAPLAGDNPFGAVAAQLLADAFTAAIPVRVTGPEGTILEADFIPTVPGLYALRFTDETGLTGTRLFDFRPFPDPAPVVMLERPVAGRDALTLLPTATLPVRARAEDRPYAVKDLFLEYRIGDAPLRTLPLADLVAAGDLLPAVGGFAPVRVKPAGLDGDRLVPIASLRKPDGTLPADGDVITLRAAAFDWDDRTALKEPGRSKDVEIRVLSRSSLEAQFQKELAAMRPDLLRLREQQRAAREKAGEVLKTTLFGPPKPEDAAKLGQAEQTQRNVRNKVTDPAEGLRARADALRQAVEANNLPRSPVTEKVEFAADELGRLADQHLEAAEPLLNAARQEAGTATPDPKQVTDLLAKAGRHQQAAEDGLNNLLRRLEEWGGAGEVRGEARALKGRLNQADAQAEKAAEKVPDGASPEKLTPAQKAELAAAADRLDQLGDDAGGLVNKATRLAAEKENQATALRAAAAEKDRQAAERAAEADRQSPGSPAAEEAKAAAAALKAEADGMRAAADRAQAEADALRNAVREAGGQALPEDLKRAADAMRENQPGRSADARRSAADRLDKLSDDLTERPTESVDELRKKQTAAAEEIDKLAEAQDELRKKAEAAAKEADPAKREAELQKLAREQERLRRQAEQMAQRLTRDRQDKPADAVRRAAEQMEAAQGELEQGRAPTDKQDDALDRLDEALQKLDQEKKETEEQLTREQQEQIAEQLKVIRERQKNLLDEAARLQAAALKAKHWDRPLLASLRDLEDAEKNLADEVRTFAEKNLAELPVFAKLAEQSAAAMERAARYLGQRQDDIFNAEGVFDPEAETATGAKIERPMQTALRRLDQILDAVKDDPKKKDRPAGQPNGQPGGDMGPGDMGQGQPGGGIPPLAQLKALRAMQAEVNERTAAFAKAHPPEAKLTEDDEDELKELEQAQKDVAELFEKLTPLLKPPAPADPEIP